MKSADRVRHQRCTASKLERGHLLLRVDRRVSKLQLLAPPRPLALWLPRVRSAAHLHARDSCCSTDVCTNRDADAEEPTRRGQRLLCCQLACIIAARYVPWSMCEDEELWPSDGISNSRRPLKRIWGRDPAPNGSRVSLFLGQGLISASTAPASRTASAHTGPHTSHDSTTAARKPPNGYQRVGQREI